MDAVESFLVALDVSMTVLFLICAAVLAVCHVIELRIDLARKKRWEQRWQEHRMRALETSKENKSVEK